MVSMQGPQGAGKSTLANALVDMLRDHGVRCTVSSLDGERDTDNQELQADSRDFYFPYTGLKEVARRNPSNKMLQGRGLPGTHDVKLLRETLAAISSSSGSQLNIPLPIFDKSKHAGFGDRSAEQTVIGETPDVFLLEGWSLGFRPLPLDILKKHWQTAKHAGAHSWQAIEAINRNLEIFAESIYGFFDAHISLHPDSYNNIYDWRTQQEHAMKARNGGIGMTDAEVIAFVDRYMPVYELYGDTTESDHCLTLNLGKDRSVLSVE
jgi:D-glycerate 3-kinase